MDCLNKNIKDVKIDANLFEVQLLEFAPLNQT